MSESDNKKILVEVPAGNWADHMEYVEALDEFELEPSKSTSQPELPLAMMTKMCWTSAWTYTVYRRSNRRLSSGQYTATASVGQDDTSFFSLYCAAAFFLPSLSWS